MKQHVAECTTAAVSHDVRSEAGEGVAQCSHLLCMQWLHHGHTAASLQLQHSRTKLRMRRADSTQPRFFAHRVPSALEKLANCVLVLVLELIIVVWHIVGKALGHTAHAHSSKKHRAGARARRVARVHTSERRSSISSTLSTILCPPKHVDPAGVLVESLSRFHR